MTHSRWRVSRGGRCGAAPLAPPGGACTTPVGGVVTCDVGPRGERKPFPPRQSNPKPLRRARSVLWHSHVIGPATDWLLSTYAAPAYGAATAEKLRRALEALLHASWLLPVYVITLLVSCIWWVDLGTVGCRVRLAGWALLHCVWGRRHARLAQLSPWLASSSPTCAVGFGSLWGEAERLSDPRVSPAACSLWQHRKCGLPACFLSQPCHQVPANGGGGF